MEVETMTRAYMKLDPLAFERKAVEDHYTPAEFGAFMAVLILGEHQAERGRFRSEHSLRSQLDDPDRGVKGYARFVRTLIERGDLVRLPDTRLYIDGWDEWQEGDLTVTDRMARLRNRKRNADRNVTVTPLSDGTELDGTTDGERDATRAPDDQTALQKLAEELTDTPYVLANLHGGHGAKALSQLHRHGLAAVERAWRDVALDSAKPPTIRQLLFGAEDVLDPITHRNGKAPVKPKGMLPSLAEVEAAFDGDR